jgi:hypothetical protein
MEDTTKIPRTVAIGTGVLALSSAAYGLYLSLKSFIRAIGGGFTEFLQQYEVPYFYPAFYSMLSVTIVCCLVLAWCGLDQVRLRVAHLKLFIWLFVCEVMYFFFIGGFLWPLPDTGMSIGAASGVANNGLMPPFYILLPLWAPFALAWAKKRLTNGTTGNLTEPLRTEAEGHCETSLGRVINSRVLTALVGGVGGGISSFLLLWDVRLFGALNEYLSDFTLQVVAFFLGGSVRFAQLSWTLPQLLDAYLAGII